MLWISQLHQLVSGEDEGKCHTDFLWFANLGFAGKKNGEEKKKREKTSQFYIYPETTEFKLESILGHLNAHRKAIVEQNCSLVLLL